MISRCHVIYWPQAEDFNVAGLILSLYLSIVELDYKARMTNLTTWSSIIVSLPFISEENLTLCESLDVRR